MISKNFRFRFYTSLALFSLLYLFFNYKIVLLYFLIIFGVLSILEFLNLTKKIFIRKTKFLLLNLIFLIFIFTFCLIFFFLSESLGSKILLYITLLGCIASDIGGFIFGKIFKGPKLTRISPNKTFSGAIGSLFLTIISTSFIFLFFLQSFSKEVVIYSIITSVFCQIGDLLFSYLKRKAKQKDTGSIFPGHGGILDRFDGIFLGLPAGLITIMLIF